MPRISIKAAKAKGAALQKWVRDAILAMHPTLTCDDVRSCPMGSGGVDVQLSEAAKALYPFNVECKAKANGFTPVYDALAQASRGDGRPPVAYLKHDRRRVIAAMYADDLHRLMKP